MVQHGATWCNMVQHGATWCNMVQRNMVQHGATWCNDSSGDMMSDPIDPWNYCAASIENLQETNRKPIGNHVLPDLL